MFTRTVVVPSFHPRRLFGKPTYNINTKRKRFNRIPAKSRDGGNFFYVNHRVYLRQRDRAVQLSNHIT